MAGRPGEATTDAELVTAVQNGDPAAFELLYRRHVATVRKAVGASVRDPEKAADAVQDVFARALERIDTLRDPDKLEPWLAAMARNSAVDQHRVRRHSDIDDLPEEVLVDRDPGPGEEAELRDLARLVRGVLTELSSRDVHAISLAAYLGFTPTEVAGAIGTTPGAAKVALHRARRRLKSALELELLVRRRGSTCAEFAELADGEDLVAAATHAAECEQCQQLVGEELELYDSYTEHEAERAFAVIHPGTAREKRVPVTGRLVVGRECAGVAEAQRLLTDDPVVSRHHLEIRAEPDLGGAFVIDASANGTRLNGTRIERGVLVPLSPGDRLELGDTEIRFDSRPAAARPRAGARTTIRRFSHGPMVMVVGDIVGYSRIAEQNDSATLTQALDDLFSELRGLLRLHGGMLANYAGDAFFGAWELDSIPDGTERGVAFAQQAAERVRGLAPSLGLAREQELRMGWGVTAGEATVSVLTGALTTVVGDAANLAFRLSGLAGRDERADVLVLADTAAMLAGEVGFGERETLAVKGRSEPVAVVGASGG